MVKPVFLIISSYIYFIISSLLDFAAVQSKLVSKIDGFIKRFILKIVFRFCKITLCAAVLFPLTTIMYLLDTHEKRGETEKRKLAVSSLTLIV